MEIPLEELTIQSDKNESGKEVEIEDVHEESHQELKKESFELDISSDQPLPKELRYNFDHSKDLVIGDPSKAVTTRTSLRNICNNFSFVYQIEPKNFKEAKHDDSWTLAMQEELNQFERNNVWNLVLSPSSQSVIGTKWVF